MALNRFHFLRLVHPLPLVPEVRLALLDVRCHDWYSRGDESAAWRDKLRVKHFVIYGTTVFLVIIINNQMTETFV